MGAKSSVYPSLKELEKQMSMQNKDTDFSNHDLIYVDFSMIS